MTILICPSCSSRNTPGEAYMGALGSLTHLRCRFCGWQWSESIDPRELENDEDDDDDY